MQPRVKGAKRGFPEGVPGLRTHRDARTGVLVERLVRRVCRERHVGGDAELGFPDGDASAVSLEYFN